MCACFVSLESRLTSCDLTGGNERVDLVAALVGVDSLDVEQVLHDLEVKDDSVAADELTGKEADSTGC